MGKLQQEWSMRVGGLVGLVLAIVVVGYDPYEVTAQPRIDFKSRELQEGRNYLQRLMGAVSVGGSGGSLSYEFPLTAPPGRGMTPALSLVYSSSAGYSEYGYGWELTLPMIERDTSKGVPHYFDNPDHFSYRAGFEKRSLVSAGETTSDGWKVFREETEKSFSRYLFKNNGWRILSPDGKRLELGTTVFERRGRLGRTTEATTAAWLATRLIDTHGNYILYEYSLDRFSRALLRRVRYTGNEPLGTAPMATIEFVWTDASIAQLPKSSRRGYEEGFGLDLLSSVIMTAPPMVTGSSPAVIPTNSPSSITYTFAHERAGPNRLFRIIRITTDNSPPVEFDYSRPWMATTPFASRGIFGDLLPPSLTYTETESISSSATRTRSRRVFVDVTGDGLPDIVDTEVRCNDSDWLVWKNMGDHFDKVSWPHPPGAGAIDFCATRVTEGGNVQNTRQDFFDLTGDALPDFVFFPSDTDDTLRVCPGNGHGFDGCISWGTFPAGTTLVTTLRRDSRVGNLGYTDVDMVDFNADGYVDRVNVSNSALSNPSIEVVYNNRGTGWGVRRVFSFPACGYPTIVACLRLTEEVLTGVGNRRLVAESRDVNGDGLVDFLTTNVSSGTVFMSPGTGGSFPPLQVATGLPTLGIGNQPADGVYFAKTDLIDMNGDRLPDLVERAPGRIDVRYNYGGAWVPTVVSYPLTAGRPGFFLGELSRAQAINPAGSGVVSMVVDVDGDDLPDVISVPHDIATMPSEYEVQSLPYRVPHALIRTLSLNGNTDSVIEYAAQGAGAIPFAVHTPVSVIRSRIPLHAGEGPALTSHTTTYEYVDPVYDGVDREFRGFQTVVSEDQDRGVLTQTNYLQDKHTQGMVLTSVVANVIAEGAPRLVINQYTEVSQASAGFPPVTFVRLDRKTVSDGSLFASRELDTYYSQYEFGQPTTQIQDDDPTTNADDIIDTLTFTVRSDSDFFLVVPRSTARYRGGLRVAASDSYFDDRTVLGTPPTKGNLVKTRRELTFGNFAYDEKTYDDEAGPGYGLVTTTTDSEGAVTTHTYDATYHQYEVSLTNAIGTVHASYHALTGTRADACGPRRLGESWNCTRAEIDVLGRVIATFVPSKVNGSFVKTRMTQYEYDDWSYPLKTVLTRRPLSPDSARTFQYRDGFGNFVEAKSEFTPGQFRTYEVVADPLGNPITAEPPRLESSSAYSHVVSGLATHYTYDQIRGDIESATFPRDSGDPRSPARFTRVHDGVGVDVVDEIGNETRYDLDGLGQVTAVHRAVGTALENVTTFTYDGNGKLSEIVDPGGESYGYGFDMAGRQWRFTAPGGGTWVNELDHRGSLTSVTDARGRQVRYVRDALGRIERVYSVAPGSSEHPVDERTLYYDASTPEYRGLVLRNESTISLRGPSTVKRTSLAYDALGNETAVRYEIDATKKDLVFRHDVSGRLHEVEYPDRSVVYYNHNLDDSPESVTDDAQRPWATLTYDSHGRLGTLTSDYGLDENYDYDVRDRPEYITSSNSHSTWGTIVQDSFVWSDSSQLKEVMSAGLALGPAFRTTVDNVTHYYDALGRLATSTRNGQTFASYGYNANGSLDSASENDTSSYAYDGDLLEAQCWSGACREFTHDANGSVVTQTRVEGGSPKVERQYGWDDLGRLVVTSESRDNIYRYQYLGGERIRTVSDTSIGGSHDVVELGKWARFDRTDGTLVKHITLGDRVLFEDRGLEGISMPHRSLGASVNAVSLADGSIVRQEEFYPYGAPSGSQGVSSFDEHHHGLRQDDVVVAGSRAYDPLVRRWLARDGALASPPSVLSDIRLLDGYGYNNSAPTNYRDPSGRGGDGTDYEYDPTERNSFRDSFGADHRLDPEGGPVDVQMQQATMETGYYFATLTYFTVEVATLPRHFVPFVDTATSLIAGDYEEAAVSAGTDVAMFVGVGLVAKAYRMAATAHKLRATATAVNAVTDTARVVQTATKRISAAEQIKINKINGDKFRDEIMDRLRNMGYTCRSEVHKPTIFGPRRIDIEVSLNGKVLGGIEVKTGGAKYEPHQRAKDTWLKRRTGYIVTLLRDE